MSELCHTCTGACCRDMRFIATPEEAAHLAGAGTDIDVYPRVGEILDLSPGELEEVGTSKETRMQVLLEAARLLADGPPIDQVAARSFVSLYVELCSLPSGIDMYEIKGECGYLQEGRCSDYDNRPDFCRDFPPGQSACMSFRERAGIETSIPIEITNKTV